MVTRASRSPQDGSPRVTATGLAVELSGSDCRGGAGACSFGAGACSFEAAAPGGWDAWLGLLEHPTRPTRMALAIACVIRCPSMLAPTYAERGSSHTLRSVTEVSLDSPRSVHRPLYVGGGENSSAR